MGIGPERSAVLRNGALSYCQARSDMVRPRKVRFARVACVMACMGVDRCPSMWFGSGRKAGQVRFGKVRSAKVWCAQVVSAMVGLDE